MKAPSAKEVFDIDLDQMFIHDKYAKHMFSDYKDLILIIPTKLEKQFIKFKNKNWVFFDPYANDIFITTKNIGRLNEVSLEKSGRNMQGINNEE